MTFLQELLKSKLELIINLIIHTRVEEIYTWGKNIQHPERKGLYAPLNNVLYLSFLPSLVFYVRNVGLVKCSVIWVPEVFLLNTSQKKLLKENKNYPNEGRKYSLFTCFSAACNVFS